MTLLLKDFAGGVTLDDGRVPITNAIAAAFAAAQDSGRDIQIGPGLFRVEQRITIPSGVTVRGVRGRTTLLHAPGCYENVVTIPSTTVGATLKDVILSGGVGHESAGGLSNHSDDHGFQGAELIFAGRDNLLDGVVITEWNDTAAWIASDGDNVILRSGVERVPPAIYKPTSGVTASRDMGGRYGWVTSGYARVDGLRMIDCWARGTRGPGMFIGGTNSALIRPHAAECHREYEPCNPDPGGFYSGGGQIALAVTWAGWGPGENQVPQKFLIDSPFISASDGPSPAGLEIGAGYDVSVRAPHIWGPVTTAIAIRNVTNLDVEGGFLANATIAGLSITDSTHIRVSTRIVNCPIGVDLGGSSDYIDLTGMDLYANPINLRNTMSGAHLRHSADGGWA